MEQQAISGDHQNAPVLERRDAHRRRVLKSGVIHFNGGYASYACKIRNMTEKGVMIEMGETTGIPQEFTIRLDEKEPIAARVVWRNSTRIGIALR